MFILICKVLMVMILTEAFSIFGLVFGVWLFFM